MECPVDHVNESNPSSGGPVQGQEPPLVKGIPLLGSMAELVKSPLYFLEDKHKEYGNVFRFTAAHKKFTVLAGAEANRFMTGEGRDFFTSRETWGKFLKGVRSPHLFIGIDGEEHAYQRKIFKPTFSKAAFKERLHLLTNPLEKTLDNLADGEEILVGPFVRNVICKQIGLALQGVEVDSQQTEEIMTTQNTFLNVYMLGKWPKVVFLFPKNILSIYKTLNFIKKVRQENLERTQEQRAQCPTYIDKLEQGQKEHPEWFTEGDMRAQTLLPFVGGVDPVGGTLSFMLYELMHRPDLHQRVVKEIDAVYKENDGDFPTLEQLESMEDTKGLILETMRLHPIAYAMSRSATEDFVFQGYKINKGDELMVYTVANHFKDEYFPNAKTFDIERYRAPRNENKQGAVFAPFGKGPHTCVAAGLAELQLMVNTVMLLRTMDIKPAVDMNKVTKKFIPGPFMSENFKVALTRRI